MNKLSIVRQQLSDDASDLVKAKQELLSDHASLSPKYFYDALGCRLFEAICLLPEYYPTRTEASIFARYRKDIAQALRENKNFVDLGAGDCQKGALWLPHLKVAHYLAVDIAEAAIVPACEHLVKQYPDTAFTAVMTDFTQGFDIKDTLGLDRTTIFYPGSSIGNFTPPQAVQFLERMAAHTQGGGVLIGVDMIKDKARLEAAYDDAVMVTAAFNLNGLRHLLRLLNAQGNVADFRHRALFNTAESRIEMHLEAIRETQISMGDEVRVFQQGERIHTENSYKYSVHSFTELLKQAGLNRVQHWHDLAGDFAVFYARV